MKKTLAILIAVLLVVSMFSVLVACDNEPTEFTITFRESNGKQIAQKTTTEGKVTQADPTKEGYTFGGWYVAASDTELYGEKVDLATYKFTKDTDLYAKWDRKITPGESQGYVLIGAGVEYGDWNTETAVKGEKAKKLVQDTTEVNKYSFTWDVAALDQFKVITALGTVGSWDVGEINKGFEAVSSISKKDGVEQDPAALLVDSGDGNIRALCAMNLTLTLVYAGKEDTTIELTINSIPEGAKVPSPIEEVGYGIIGQFEDSDYTEKDDDSKGLTLNSTTSSIELTPNATGTQWKYEGLTLKADDEFFIRVNEDIPGLASYNKSSLHRIDLDGATLPEGVAKEDLFKKTKANIVARCDMTIDVILYTNSYQIAIKVKSVTLESAADLTDDLIPANIAGSFNGWDGQDTLMTANSDYTKFTKTLELAAGAEFKVRKFQSWDVCWGISNVKSVTLADGVTVEDLTEDGVKDYFVEGSDNIKMKVACTITVEVDINSGDINITVTAVAA